MGLKVIHESRFIIASNFLSLFHFQKNRLKSSYTSYGVNNSASTDTANNADNAIYSQPNVSNLSWY